MVDPSIFQLPPAIIEEAKKAKDPEWRIELACLELRTHIMLTTNIKIDSTRAFMECMNKNKWTVKPVER
jgi:hypothetical protein